MPSSALRHSLLLLAALAAAPGFANEAPSLSFAYTGEYARSLGTRPGGDAYADQFHLSGTTSSDRLGWQGGTFVVEVTRRTGKALEQVLDLPLLQQVQSIHGSGNVTRLTQLSYRHAFDAVPVAVTIGRIYPNADFLAFSCHYQHMSFCGGAPGNVSNGWFTDPVSQYGVVLAADVGPAVRVKLGAYDVNPRNQAPSQGLRLHTSGGSTGTLFVGEIEVTSGDRGHWRLGGWHDSSDYAGVAAVPADGTTTLHDGESGLYLALERDLARLPSGQTLRGFVNIVRADAETNAIDRLEAVGLWLDAPFAARPQDRVALALGRTRVSRRLQGDAAPDATAIRAEYPLELNYNAVLTPWLTVMPNLQHIRQTGPGRTSLNVLGLRIEIGF